MMVRHRLVLLASALVAVLCLTSNADAQERRGRGGFGGRGMGAMVPGMDGLMLLGQEPVQKELKLTTEQTTAVREAADEVQSEMREVFSGLQDLSPEERREKMQELRVEMGKKVGVLRGKVDNLLDAAQKARLRQLLIQRRGAFGSLQDAEVATALNLTEEQKKKVETLAEESRPRRGPGGGEGGGDPRAMRERFQALMKERNDKALQILTADQKAELEKLQGPKFEFPAEGPGRPGA